MIEQEHGVRLTRVENEVSGIKTDVADLKAQMRGFGGILERIEVGISTSQKQAIEDKNASRTNPVALATVLITIISILIGGAWLISAELARGDERSLYQQKMLDRIELRQWQQRRGSASATPEAPPQ